MTIRTEKPEPVEITELRLTRHSKGYALLRDRYQKMLDGLRRNLEETDGPDRETAKVRAKIDVLKTVISLPDIIEQEWKQRS